MKERWAPMTNRVGERMKTAHLLRADGSPTCGAVYFTSRGEFPGSDALPHCRNCEMHAARRRLKAAS